MFSSNCCFLTCIHIYQEAGQVVWRSHVLKNFPQFVVIYTAKGCGVIHKAEVVVFLVFSWFFNHPTDVGNLISGSSAFEVLLKPGLENFEHSFANMCDECNCAVVWTFFAITFLWDWNENWPFPVLWLLLSFPKLIECSTLTASSFRTEIAQLEFHYLH